jgi:hypothetical protein
VGILKAQFLALPYSKLRFRSHMIRQGEGTGRRFSLDKLSWHLKIVNDEGCGSSSTKPRSPSLSMSMLDM